MITEVTASDGASTSSPYTNSSGFEKRAMRFVFFQRQRSALVAYLQMMLIGFDNGVFISLRTVRTERDEVH